MYIVQYVNDMYAMLCYADKPLHTMLFSQLLFSCFTCKTFLHVCKKRHAKALQVQICIKWGEGAGIVIIPS